MIDTDLTRKFQLPASLVKYGPLLAWLGAAGAIVLLLWQVVIPATQHNDYAFAAYYTSSRLTLQGEAGPRFCDAWFTAQQRGFGFEPDIFCPSPPPMALLLLPVAWLPPMAARAAWVALTLALVAAVCWLARRILAHQETPPQPLAGVALPIMIILVAVYQPLHSELRFGQVYALLGLGYALWLYGSISGRAWLCGAAMAGLVLVKLAGWPLWLFALLRGHWRMLGWAAGLALAGAIATLPLLGLDFWQLYVFQQMASIAPDPTNAVTAYQTITSLLRQLFVYDARWSPAPLLDAPWLASLLWWATTLVLLGLTLRRDTPDTRLLTALALLCLVVPLQPAGEQHHYVILFVVWFIVIGMRRTLATAAPRRALGFGGALLLFALPPYFVSVPRLQGWPAALLAYPRLYGALLLWATLLMLRERIRAASEGRAQ